MNFLVVYNHNCAAGLVADVYGARVSPNAALLGEFPISAAPNFEGRPNTAFDGTNYLVAWKDNRAGAGFGVHGARVTPAGAVLDPEGFVISAGWGADPLFGPSVAFAGGNYAVAWGDRSGSDFEILGTLVTPLGIVTRPEGVQISIPSSSTGSMIRRDPSIGAGDTRFLVGWGIGDIYGRLVPSSPGEF